MLGFTLKKNLPEHVLLNWYGVLRKNRKMGYGKQILKLAIKKAKILFPDKSFLTYYSDKVKNKIAVKLYKKMRFVTKDYCNKKDVAKIEKLTKNNYVIGIYLLKKVALPNLENINLDIAKEIKILSEFN